MSYEINIAKDGKHYFATAERSLMDFHRASEVYKDLVQKFPPEQGYQLSLTRWDRVGKYLTSNGFPTNENL